MANSVSTDGGGSREGSRDNDKIATQFPSARNPHQNFPQARGGEKERGGATSESGFRMAHGKKQLRHSELHSLQEIKNQELSECEPSSASSLYNSQSKTWGSRTFEPQKGGNRVQHGSHSTRSNGSSDSGAFATPHAIPQGDTAPWDSPDWLASQKRV